MKIEDYEGPVLILGSNNRRQACGEYVVEWEDQAAVKAADEALLDAGAVEIFYYCLAGLEKHGLYVAPIEY